MADNEELNHPLVIREIVRMHHEAGISAERKYELLDGAAPTELELKRALNAHIINVDRYQALLDYRPEPDTTRSDILQEASVLTYGERNDTYGDFSENHERIAQMWSLILQQNIYPDQVALCMAMVKISRLIESPKHRDTYVDACAYIAGAAEIALKDS